MAATASGVLAVSLLGAVAPAAHAAACPTPTSTFDLATGYTTVVFDQGSVGTACDWTVPSMGPNITALEVIAIGGGGGGGGGAGAQPSYGQGGGGGAGQVTELTGGSAVTVVPGETITITIGAKGSGGANQAGGTVGSSTTVDFATATDITAAGGSGGGVGGTYQQGVGGGSGNGVAGNATQNCLNGLMANGNGGSGATAAGGTGGCGTTGQGGAQGAGYSSVILNATVGLGGRGGGALSGTQLTAGVGDGGEGSNGGVTSAVGFAGGDGLVAFRYLTPAPSAPGAPVAVAGAGFATVTVTPPSPNSGGPILSYTVTASPGGATCTVQPPQTSCVVSPLTPGTSYTFTSTATSRPNATSSASTSSNAVTPTAASAPTAATNVAVTAMTTTSQTVGWTAATGGPASYAVQAYTGGSPVSGATCSATPPATTCQVTGLTAGTTYTYIVTATNSAGSTPSAMSSPATIPTGAPSTPPAPVVMGGPFIEQVGYGYPYVAVFAPQMPAADGVTSFTATVTSDASGAGGSSGSVTCTITPPAQYCIAPVRAYGYTDDSYPISVTVTATNVAGTSAASLARSRINGGAPGVYANGAPLPAAPAIATTAANGVATVTFTAGTPVTADVGAYLVQAKLSGAVVTSCRAVVPATTCDLTGLTGGTAYSLEAFAFASGGSPSDQKLGIVPSTVPTWPAAGSWSPSRPPNPNPPAIGSSAIVGRPSIATTTSFTMPASAPGTPGTPTAVAGSGQATVTFTAPSSGGTPTSYTATSSPGGYTCTVAASANPLQCTVTGLTNGTAYTFTTTATNGAGTSPASAPTAWSVTPFSPSGAPGTPGAVTATVASSTSAAVVISSAASGSVSSYTVSSSPGGQTCTLSAPFTSPLTCTVSNLTAGGTYTFSASATNLAGTSGSTAASNSVTLPSAPGTPPTPSALPTASGTATITVTPPASNGGSAITGYTVTHVGSGNTCTLSSPLPSPLACSITNLSTNVITVHSFTVMATNVIGTSTASAAATMRFGPPAAPPAPTAVAGNASATVTVAAASSGGTPTSYTVTSSPSGGSCTVTAPATSCTVTGLAVGTSYTFTATATNYNTTSSASPASNAVTPTGGGSGGGGGGGGSSSGSSTGAPVVPAGVPAPAPVPAGLAPGGASVVVGGQSVTPTVQPLNLGGGSAGNAIAVSGPGFQSTVVGPSVGGAVPRGSLTIVAGLAASVSASGYQPGATVVVLLMPAGTTVGTATANSLGVVTISATIPSGAAGGAGALQINGVGAGASQLAMTVGTQVVTGIAPVRLTSGALPSLAPGKAANTAAGTLATATTTRVAAGGLRVVADQSSMTVAGVSGQGAALPLTASGALIVQEDLFVKVSGSGFAPNTYVGVWAFSEPQFVGLVLTDPAGSYTAQLPLPQDLPVGDHTLQANGTTKAGAAYSASLGMRVLSNDGVAAVTGAPKTTVRTARERVLFVPMSSTLTPTARRNLQALVRTVGKRASGTVVVGFVQGSNSSANDVSLSRARAVQVAAYLRAQGLVGPITTKPGGVASTKHSADARRVDVNVTYRK